MNKGFRDECGVFGVFDSEDAARLAYLGLYALQHRGQESAGIVTLDDEGRVSSSARWDTSRTSSTRRGFRVCRGGRPSATSGTRRPAPRSSINAQPIVFATGRGPLALAHNGNLVNAREIRARLEASGALFTTTSDSELILHLVARSKARTLSRGDRRRAARRSAAPIPS